MKKKSNFFVIILAVVITVSIGCGGQVKNDILIADFEGGDYGGWEASGNAFGEAPTRGKIGNQRPVSGYKGEGLVNTFFNGNSSTGVLTSPPFTIERAYINFLIGGGKHTKETCINLVVGSNTVRTATGKNDELLTWSYWDVSEFKGKSARIQIADSYTGGWGHINIDNIIQSGTAFVLPDLTKELVIKQNYMNLPVKTGTVKRRMKVTIDGVLFDEFDIELADGDMDFCAFIDVGRFRGKKALIQVNQPWESNPEILEQITISDKIANSETLYKEKYRPQFHFSPRRGWTNDPNGLVYYKGEYHLFFQHNPYGWNWGNMHWGHAVSTDLVRWKELSVALYPHRYGDWCFSGSAAVDHNNTSGFRTGTEDVLIAAYTSTGRGESIAYSNDRGRTWTDYEGNPVVKHAGRDPKIIWHKQTSRWIMAVYDIKNEKNTIAFYTSTNLKNWEYQSSIEGYYECPEIFELPVDGDMNNRKWVIYAADGNYAIGTFDGSVFTKESGKHSGNYGNCFYASQTFNGIPPGDGRRIQIGWARINMPGMPFNQMMTFPCVLALRTTAEGVRLFYEPVKEIENLYGKKRRIDNKTLKQGENLLTGISGDTFDIYGEFETGKNAELVFDIRGVEVVYSADNSELSCLDKTAPLEPVGGIVKLRILVDRTSIEIFGNNGRIYMPVGIIPDDSNKSLGVFGRNGSTKIKSLVVHELVSAWE